LTQPDYGIPGEAAASRNEVVPAKTEKLHRRDAEDAEKARDKAEKRPLRTLCDLCASAVNSTIRMLKFSWYNFMPVSGL
jgi:hypothetical protein